jgi:four helix bundle protein
LVKEGEMPFVRFQDLDVYKISEKLSDSIWDIVETWKPLARDTTGKELVRCCDSIGANIAEGAGLGTRTNNRRHVRIARGSFYETQHWLRRAYARRLLTDEQVAALRQMMNALGPKLNAYLSSFGRGKSDNESDN